MKLKAEANRLREALDNNTVPSLMSLLSPASTVLDPSIEIHEELRSGTESTSNSVT